MLMQAGTRKERLEERNEMDQDGKDSMTLWGGDMSPIVEAEEEKGRDQDPCSPGSGFLPVTT